MSTWWPALTAAAVVLVGTLVGVLGNWSDRRPKIIASPARYRTAFAGAVAVAVGLAVVQAVIAGRVSQDGGTADWRASSPTATAATGTAGGGLFLDQLPVDLGAGNIQRTLPRELSGRPGYAHPLLVPCATGQATDQFREVRYALFKRYLTLSATVDAFESTPDESRVQVRFFRDSQPPVDRTVPVGGSAELTLDLSGVDDLVIRVTCESSSASAILANAVLRHA